MPIGHAKPDILNINLLNPILQTSLVTAANTISGKLNHHSVAFPQATLIAALASLVSSVTKNLFNNVVFSYLATGVGIAVAFAVRSLMSSTKVDPRTVLLVAGPILLTEVCFDIIHHATARPVQPPSNP
jgi:uncharacterized membrane protein YjjP (DUF1212 family)